MYASDVVIIAWMWWKEPEYVVYVMLLMIIHLVMIDGECMRAGTRRQAIIEGNSKAYNKRIFLF